MPVCPSVCTARITRREKSEAEREREERHEIREAMRVLVILVPCFRQAIRRLSLPLTLALFQLGFRLFPRHESLQLPFAVLFSLQLQRLQPCFSERCRGSSSSVIRSATVTARERASVNRARETLKCVTRSVYIVSFDARPFLFSRPLSFPSSSLRPPLSVS